MDIKTLTSTIRFLPADISVLVRGPHGIGKSQVAAQLAEDEGKTLIDRRLSQMSEGDMVGLPELVDGVTRFCPPDWYARACKEPTVLLLDELNRATPEVMQAAFQIVLDRELNGHRLHEGTRVVACINASAEYEVNEMDPALLDRFWVCDLEPSDEDWLTWAADRIHPMIQSFIRQNPAHLRHKEAVEPGKVYPSPRSWERVDSSLKAAGIVDDHSSPAFYPICLGLLGVEASISFKEFCKTYEAQVSAEDILNDFAKVKPLLADAPQDRMSDLIEKLVNNCKDNEWTVTQAKSIKKFAALLNDEMLVQLWNRISSTQNLPNIQKVHKEIGAKVVGAVNAGRNVK